MKLKIWHNLLALPGTAIESIHEVRSHYQALDQCRGFLAKHRLRGVPVYDTSGAAKEVRDKNLSGIAAIASSQAAADFDLAVLSQNIQNREDNYTRFHSVQKGVGDELRRGRGKAE